MLKFAGLALLLVLVIGVTAFIASVWYIRQPTMIEKIRAQASAAVGGAVDFSAIDLNLSKGFTVRDIRVYPGPEALPDGEFFQAEGMDFRYLPWKFFRRTIEFKNVILQKPHLILRQARDGSWRMPHWDLRQLTDQLTFQTGLLRFFILLDDFELRDGRVTFLNDRGREVFGATGLQLNGSLALEPGNASADGKLRIRQMLVARTLQIDALTATLQLTERNFNLPDIGADIHGGRLGGDLQVDFAAQEPSFQALVNLTSVQLASLLREFKAREGLLEGQIDAKAQLSGTVREPNLVQGTGEFEIHNCRLSGLGVSGTVAEVLRIPELASQTFPKVKGTFKIAEEQITFYNLEAVSPRMQATATGKIGLQRSLDFDVQLALSPEVLASLPADVRKRLNLRPDGYGSVTFKVEGTLDAPHSNLLDKISGQP